MSKEELTAEWKGFRRTQVGSMTPVTEEMILHFMNTNSLGDVSISAADLNAGSPKIGDMIARNPKNHKDQWLVAKQYFQDNFEPLEDEGTFLDRLHKEERDLSEKIEKLSSFLVSPQSEKITKRQRELLTIQVGYMREYRYILVLRLDNLNNS